MSNDTRTHTHQDGASTGRLQQIWADLSSADRQVLMGHDRIDLTAGDHAQLAGLVTSVARQAHAPRRDRGRRAPRTTRT